MKKLISQTYTQGMLHAKSFRQFDSIIHSLQKKLLHHGKKISELPPPAAAASLAKTYIDRKVNYLAIVPDQ
eukprot:CAMPEP_0116889212 /NCGR_PEP_ID=MMETSP0463-20121206/24594_1 /TAXON_ID=181622 /ORGANISM="Strombidinopsis sp, Strain SopsisLIS2011" /LENGTH=70 /DNA_ID=CAMNT_0004555471 /DNA_START=522 /DNA_END=734 /DNA_ORIENTATION=-